ncbi:hypothetical protein ACQPXH_06900 [Nocardia sp. CA-135953]|uniref:hypothetical protein n=1 Tax=Nocardia sp. CA-135953 TaxID=3239978 RepID=UPI003D959337
MVLPLGQHHRRPRHGALRPGLAEDRRVRRVRARLSDEKYARACGHEPVPGLTRDLLAEPIGTMLDHNLLQELIQSTTIVLRNLYWLDGP